MTSTTSVKTTRRGLVAAAIGRLAVSRMIGIAAGVNRARQQRTAADHRHRDRARPREPPIAFDHGKGSVAAVDHDRNAGPARNHDHRAFVAGKRRTYGGRQANNHDQHHTQHAPPNRPDLAAFYPKCRVKPFPRQRNRKTALIAHYPLRRRSPALLRREKAKVFRGIGGNLHQKSYRAAICPMLIFIQGRSALSAVRAAYRFGGQPISDISHSAPLPCSVRACSGTGLEMVVNVSPWSLPLPQSRKQQEEGKWLKYRRTSGA